MERTREKADSIVLSIMIQRVRKSTVTAPSIPSEVCLDQQFNREKSGMNPKTLQYIMGHSDIGVTLNTYTYVGFEDAESELQRVMNFQG